MAKTRSFAGQAVSGGRRQSDDQAAIVALLQQRAGSGSAHGALRARFLERGIGALWAMSDRLGSTEIRKAIAASSDTGTLLAALAEPSLIDLFDAEPLSRARLRGIRARKELLEAEGGTLTPSAVSTILGISRQAVDKRRAAGKLLAVELGRRGYRYPAWQFVDEGVLPGMTEILRLLVEHPPLAQVRFFLAGNHRLGSRRPVDLLRNNEIEPVRRAARTFGEQGAA